LAVVNQDTPRVDDGFMRGFLYALGPCLLVWAGIIALIYTGIHA